MQKVTLASSDKQQSLKYWSELLGLQVSNQTDSNALLGYSEDQAKLELKFIGNFLSFHDLLIIQFHDLN